MEVIYSSEMSADFQKTTLRYIPESRTLDTNIMLLLLWRAQLENMCVFCGHTGTNTFMAKNSGAFIRQRTIPTERPPLVGEVSSNFSVEGVAWSAQRILTAVNFGFLDRNFYDKCINKDKRK
jgi:hypothetical protein